MKILAGQNESSHNSFVSLSWISNLLFWTYLHCFPISYVLFWWMYNIIQVCPWWWRIQTTCSLSSMNKFKKLLEVKKVYICIQSGRYHRNETYFDTGIDNCCIAILVRLRIANLGFRPFWLFFTSDLNANSCVSRQPWKLKH